MKKETSRRRRFVEGWRDVVAWFGRRVAAPLRASIGRVVRFLTELPWLKLGVVLAVLALVGSVVWVGSRLWNSEQDGVYHLRSPLVTAGAALLAASVAAIFIFWRNWIAEKQLQEERYKKGVELLGHETQVVRIGGLYALHQLAEGFPRIWALPVLELMCAFVRTPPRDRDKAEETPDKDKTEESEEKPLRRDVQEAVQLLGLRGRTRRREEKREQKKTKKKGIGKSPGGGRLDFHGADLAGGSWKGVDLEGADFSETRLEKANFWKAALDGANFRWATLMGAHFEEAKLDGANFALATLMGAHFEEATLTGANFWKATLTEAVFLLATLTEAHFEGATLTRANFSYARLRGVDFRRATLTKACFLGATLTDAELFGADITEASLGAADLSGVILLTHRNSFTEEPLGPVRGATRKQLEEGWIEEGRPPVQIIEDYSEDVRGTWKKMTLTERDWKGLGLDAPPKFKVRERR